MTVISESVENAPSATPTLFYDPLSYTTYDHPYEVYKQLRRA